MAGYLAPDKRAALLALEAANMVDHGRHSDSLEATLEGEPALRVVMAWQGGALAGFCVAPYARGRPFVNEHVAEEASCCGLGSGHVVQRGRAREGM